MTITKKIAAKVEHTLKMLAPAPEAARRDDVQAAYAECERIAMTEHDRCRDNGAPCTLDNTPESAACTVAADIATAIAKAEVQYLAGNRAARSVPVEHSDKIRLAAIRARAAVIEYARLAESEGWSNSECRREVEDAIASVFPAPVPVEREPRVSDAHVATWCNDPAPRSVTGRLALDLRDARAARDKIAEHLTGSVRQRERLRAERDALRIALDESVKLQSHQARMLNTYDGGERREFADGDAWLARLVECGRIRRPE